ncbi:uncharacterized protein LOC127715087 isoform X3 [Mytilus californianus]|uniref:uncharacterized protein LOC127715087 isoform X3 n=1 Tax=Mytilus californianus TaxID=6549 RepID=UPI00224651EE|nr:uncharacterized protein LOC127715087 isoform X3 [Mytilus californianus]
MSKEETLKQIFHLLQKNIHAYWKSSDQYFEMRERRVRRSRSIKASSCPTTASSTNYYIVKDQGTSITPPESPMECQCLGQQKQLLLDSHNDVSTDRVLSEVHVLDKNEKLPGNTISNIPDGPLSEIMNTIDESKEVEEIISEEKFNSPALRCPSTPDTENSESFVFGNIIEQQLSIMRENIDLKIQMQKVKKHVNSFRKDNEDDEIKNHHFTSIDDILSKVLCTQKRSEILCDKLCEGLCKVKETDKKLPAHLREFCDSIRKTVGLDFRQIGRELGVEPDKLSNIEDEYSDAEECLHQIILEWSTRTEKPSYHALVTACCNVNPDILKCKPLDEKKAMVLEQNYSMMCEEMLEVPLLPYLISAGVMSLKMQRYVLQPKTHDQRICRLLNILKTRENGFEALLCALDLSDQSHVSALLKSSLERETGETFTQTDVTCYEDYGQGKMSAPCILRPKRLFSSCESLDNDESKSPAYNILMKIQEMITKLDFPEKH